ncbi:unnamed protein product [Zymoseptoria tritici ST99CH_3D1]|nr:unnamed protein product [Zymoseptoria tritici ST99CH_3D1]
MDQPFSLSLGLEDTHVLITGGNGLIGRRVVAAFLAAGSKVSIIDLPSTCTAPDINPSRAEFHPADITDAAALDAAFSKAEAIFGPVECCLAIASIDLSSLPQTESICDADPEVWRKVFDVNIHGTFLTAQRWLRGIRTAVADEEKRSKLRNASLILMGSEAGRFGVRTMPAYAAGKAAVQYGLLASLAKDVPKVWLRARVNCVAPGTVATERFREECERFGRQWQWEESEAAVGLARPVPIDDVARTFLFLASERYSGSTHGQLLHVDSGKMGTLQWLPEDLAARQQAA